MSTASDNDIKLTFERQQLSLQCDQKVLSRLVGVLRAEVSDDQWQAVDENSIKVIFITGPPPVREPTTWRGRIAGAGCFLLALSVVFVFVVGVTTLANALTGK